MEPVNPQNIALEFTDKLQAKKIGENLDHLAILQKELDDTEKICTEQSKLIKDLKKQE